MRMSQLPGVKFKDADLLGTPIRLTISSRPLKEVPWKSNCEGKRNGNW